MDRLIGIEIETISLLGVDFGERIESFLPKEWKLKIEDYDSSILEIISPPLDYKKEYGEIVKVFSLLTVMESAGLLAFNNDCGIHIHVDVYDLSLDNIKNVVYKYNLLEREFLSLVSPFRKKSEWCCRHYLDNDFSNKTSVLEVANTIQKGHKCYGLNLYSYSKFKTLEFRLLESSPKLHKFNLFLNLIQKCFLNI